MSGAVDPLVWYAAYGSNLSTARLGHYLAGGVPRGTTREYEGCRDPTPPREERVLTLPGCVRFAGESSVWGGGTAFYTPGDTGLVHARAYLLSLEQLGDLVAQETRHPVGRPLVLAEAGPTRHGMSYVYDVVLDLGELDGHRLLTLSSSTPPSREAAVRGVRADPAGRPRRGVRPRRGGADQLPGCPGGDVSRLDRRTRSAGSREQAQSNHDRSIATIHRRRGCSVTDQIRSVEGQ